MGEAHRDPPLTREDLARLLPGMTEVEVSDLLPPVLGPLQGVLAFYPGQYRLGYRDEQGVYHTRWLSTAAVRRAVMQEPIDFGWLPPQTIACGIGEAGHWLVRFLPAARQTIQVQWRDRDAPELTMPLPPLVFAGYGMNYFVWAAKGWQWAPTMPLFHAPLPNLYGGGRICWGGNHPPPCSAATFEAAWRMFITSPFNGDLVMNKSRVHQQDVRLQLQDLATRKRRPARYPVRDLLPMQLSLQQALHQLVH